MTVRRDGAAQALPPSRKVRALLAYLALAPGAVPRSQLCDLLWDLPSDPRGELRWCLSKLRGLVDGDGKSRIANAGDAVSLDLSGTFVDAVEIAKAAMAGVDTLPPSRLEELAALFSGEFLEGLDVERCPAFEAWLTAQRRRFHAFHAAILERLADVSPDYQAHRHLERWVELAPFDPRVHERLLAALARGGRIREGEAHLNATERLFEAEGLDTAPLRTAWQRARAEHAAAPQPAMDRSPQPALDARSLELPPADLSGLGPTKRASLAVMPFLEEGETIASIRSGPVNGLAYDVITRLAKLRSLFVIAQGTVYALHERRIGPEEAGRLLDVDYVVSGTLRRREKRITVSVELIDRRTAGLIWAEVYDEPVDDAFIVLDTIGDKIVANIASEIETVERNRAILRPPNSLDAWQAHHRGLWHMYRFDRDHNRQARDLFRQAIALDPTFARAYAGLSFTHFQDAFQGWENHDAQTELAYGAAGQGLMIDDRDPALHFAMGRAQWLRGSQEQSLAELEQSVELSPNYALGHYALAFVHSQGGDPARAVEASDYSRLLSPFDPLLFAMLGSRAMALVRLGRFEEAADWAMRAAARPNAHAHIMAIAAYCLTLTGRLEQARSYMAIIHRTRPDYGIADFLAAMQFDPVSRAVFREAARKL